MDSGEQGRFRYFSRDEITARNDNLDIVWLRDTSNDPEDEMTEPAQIEAAAFVHLRSALDEIEFFSDDLRTDDSKVETGYLWASANWPSIRLGDVLASIDAGKNVRCEERLPKQGEQGVVKISSVTWGQFDPSAVKTPLLGIHLDERARIRSGDFLISRANTLELVGACVIVGDLREDNLYLSDKVLRLRFKQPVERWVLQYLRSVQGRKQIEGLATGNQLSMRNISQASIESIRIQRGQGRYPRSDRNTSRSLGSV